MEASKERDVGIRAAGRVPYAKSMDGMESSDTVFQVSAFQSVSQGHGGPCGREKQGGSAGCYCLARGLWVLRKSGCERPCGATISRPLGDSAACRGANSGVPPPPGPWGGCDSPTITAFCTPVPPAERTEALATHRAQHPAPFSSWHPGSP